jgi:hypothetical protein
MDETYSTWMKNWKKKQKKTNGTPKIAINL